MDYVKKDLKHIWHPCSQMKDYEIFNPIVIERGEGVYLYDLEGKKYADAVSSWWCNLFGHANPKINQAIKNQLDQVEHVIFANFSNKPAIELCDRLHKLLPEGLDKFFFADNGSAAVEAALKMSFQYHMQIGKSHKKKFMALTDAYHGEKIGALSVLDISEEENILEKVREHAILFNSKIRAALADKSYVGEIRQIGLLKLMGSC